MKVCRAGLAYRYIDSQTSLTGFLVLGHHVKTGLAHSFDDLIQGYAMISFSVQRKLSCGDGLDGC